jgi:hypothetical protein
MFEAAAAAMSLSIEESKRNALELVEEGTRSKGRKQ